MDVPNDWKLANISAIFKKGDKSLPSNYRPVSLTCVICKVMESIVRDSLMQHLVNNNLISLKQFGFIKGRSTTLQLLNVLNDLTQAWEKNESVDVIYMDFMKAFDKVPHCRLLHKLEAYGIRNP